MGLIKIGNYFSALPTFIPILILILTCFLFICLMLPGKVPSNRLTRGNYPCALPGQQLSSPPQAALDGATAGKDAMSALGHISPAEKGL